jgi:hypothetical protein
MSLVLAAADESAIYIAGDSAGCVGEQPGRESDFVRLLGTRVAVALPHPHLVGIIEPVRIVALNVHIRDIALALCDRACSGEPSDGAGFSALVCGFDGDGRPECFVIQDGKVAPASAPAPADVPALWAAGIHSEVACSRVRHWLDNEFPVPSAMRRGINAAISFEEEHVFDPLERRLRLPAKVYRFDLYGALVRVL